MEGIIKISRNNLNIMNNILNHIINITKIIISLQCVSTFITKTANHPVFMKIRKIKEKDINQQG